MDWGEDTKNNIPYDSSDVHHKQGHSIATSDRGQAASSARSSYYHEKKCLREPSFPSEASHELAVCHFVRSDRITPLGRSSQWQCTSHKTCYKQHKLLWSGHPAFR